jgi:hypothetical protein
LLSTHDNPVILPFDIPARQRIESGSTGGLARSQIEAGMMPRAPDRAVDDQSFGKRAAVMRAMRTDGEELRTAPDQQHRLLADVAEKLVPIGDLVLRNSERQIRPLGLRLVSHFHPPLIEIVPWNVDQPKKAAVTMA